MVQAVRHNHQGIGEDFHEIRVERGRHRSRKEYLSSRRHGRTRQDHLVVFQKWRWTEMNVILGLVFVALLRKEWPMTFIAVRCPHCQSDEIVKRGKTARGTQRYLCQNTLCAKGSFLLDYCNRGCLPEV